MKKQHKTQSPLTDGIRQAIISSGKPLLQLANETGVQRASLSRFVSGERSLRLDMADKLAVYFEFKLTGKDVK